MEGLSDTYPNRRGHTRVKELPAAGVNVAIGHDPIMNPCYPLAAADPVQVAFEAEKNWRDKQVELA